MIIPEQIEGKAVVGIDEEAFAGCNNITRVTIPEGAVYIGERAFSGCTRLASVVMPNSVTSIDERAFYYCTSLTDVMIPDNVTYIGDLAFAACENLKTITVPNSVINIGEEAFGCVYVRSLVYPTIVGDNRSPYGTISYCSDPIIICPRNSYAHQYCVDNDIRFQLIESVDY